MATGRVPFPYISDLDPRTQYELERNFAHLQDQGSTGHSGNTFYIACINATAAEKAVADVKLDGSTDATVINALVAAHPGCELRFSSGTVHCTSSLVIPSGIRLIGTVTDTNIGILYAMTLIQFEGASSNFQSGPGFPCGIVFQAGSYAGLVENFWFSNFWTGAITSRIIFNIGSSTTVGTTFRNVQTSQTLIGTAFDFFLTTNALHSLAVALFDRCQFNMAICLGGTFIGNSVFLECIGGSVPISQAQIVNSLFLQCNMASGVPAGGSGNVIVPQLSTPPSGSAGGDLTGTYPNPTVAANAVTNAKLAQMAANTFKANNTGGTANAADITVAQAITMLGAITGDLAGSTYPALNVAGVAAASNDIKIGTVGKGFYVKEGSNATMGTATLSGGTATVSTTKVTANSRIFLTTQSLGTVATPKEVAVTARSAGTSFTITSADNTDTSVVAWVIIEPS